MNNRDRGEFGPYEILGSIDPPKFLALIRDKTEGSPLFVVDLVRELRDRGVIVEAAEGWTLAQTVSDLARDIPASIRSLIQRKQDALEDGDRQLLVAASVQGAGHVPPPRSRAASGQNTLKRQEAI